MSDPRVLALRIAPLGEGALIISVGEDNSTRTSARVHALADRLRRLDVPGVKEIVPAYDCLLVAYEWQRLDDEAVETLVRRAESEPAPPATPPMQLVVPVRYGDDAGPDLTDVAEHAGLDAPEVVRLHSGTQYSVAFIGFLPGFPYMEAVPQSIAAPRRATPRVTVPAGSVGIAARQTGIYPFASPGGWQIVGQTPLVLWDAFAPSPALFSPGDWVRFVPTDERRADPPVATPPAMRRPVFEVVVPGAHTTAQDLGRAGYGHLGVGPAGVFDTQAAALANWLVGNPAGAAVLEMTLAGPTLRVLASTTFALAGADFCCRADGVPVPPGISWFVRAGSTVSFSTPAAGLRAYLAVAGGLDVPPLLGSRSTSAYGGFGGFAGRALRRGDLLGVVKPGPEPVSLAGRVVPVGRSMPERAGVIEVRYVPYRGPQSPGEQTEQSFNAAVWSVSERSDRMGLRLQGERPLAGSGGELASFPVVQGAIQLPPDGQPIVLGPDHQTTGGYPVLGVVAQCDWPLLAQARAGTRLRFIAVERGEARALSRAAALAHEAAMRYLPPA